MTKKVIKWTKSQNLIFFCFWDHGKHEFQLGRSSSSRSSSRFAVKKLIEEIEEWECAFIDDMKRLFICLDLNSKKRNNKAKNMKR